MKEIVEAVNLAVEQEHERSKQHETTFNTMHEAYAVTLEELDEVREEYLKLENNMKALWEMVKIDRHETCAIIAQRIKGAAIYLAAEAIQVAAMAHKTAITAASKAEQEGKKA